MVVLGKGRGRGTTAKSTTKVVAPKPINLPSMRSEFSGFDPAATIIPAGGGWGSKQNEDSPRDQASTSQPTSQSMKESESPPLQQPKKEEHTTSSTPSAWGSRGAPPPLAPSQDRTEERRGPPLAKEEFPSLGAPHSHPRSNDYGLRPASMLSTI